MTQRHRSPRAAQKLDGLLAGERLGPFRPSDMLARALRKPLRLKRRVLVRPRAPKPGTILSQQDLDRWHRGCLNYAGAICTEANGYSHQTRNMQRLIDLWNAFVRFLDSLPDRIEFPDTPENRRKAAEGQAAQENAVSCTDRGGGIVLNNMERETAELESAINTLCAKRTDFEVAPGLGNRLKNVQDATSAAQSVLDRVNTYVVVDNARSRALIARINGAFNRGRACARIDEIDLLRDEYLEYFAAHVPKRSEFVRIGRPWNWGDYDYALVANVMMSAADRITTATSVTISSAYRNPKKEWQTNPKNPNSRHIYGDAVDFATKSEKALWCRVAAAACREKASWVEPHTNIPNFDHVHADWRGGNVPSSHCNDPSVCDGTLLARQLRRVRRARRAGGRIRRC